MRKTHFLSDYAPGQICKNELVAWSHLEKRMDASGKPFWNLVLGDRSDRRNARKFKVAPEDEAILRESRILTIQGKISTGKYEGQIEVDSWSPYAGEFEKSDFVAGAAEDTKQYRDCLKVLLNSVRDPNLLRLLRHMFQGQESYRNRFATAMAAQDRHHAYPGGLLEHSVEVALLCDRVCEVRPELRRDLLVTAAMLHDIGKLDEMDHGLSAGEFTDEGELLGHIELGQEIIIKAVQQIDGFPQPLCRILRHMILSHHGRPEYGAARKPATPEAYVLSQCDLLSARLFECREAARSASAGQMRARLGKSYDKHDDIASYLYVGDFGLTEPEPDARPSESVTFGLRPAPEPTMTFQTRAKALPLLGSAAAGSPEQGADGTEELVEVVLPKGGGDFLVRVVGDSMVDAGIHEGDLLIVKQAEEAQDGQTVVAVSPASQPLVKVLRRTGTGEAFLESRNAAKAYAPIPCTEETHIQGVVVGMVRDFAG